MFGLGEIVVIVVAGAWVFGERMLPASPRPVASASSGSAHHLAPLPSLTPGPQDLPRIARVVGNLTGRAMGTLYRARAQLFQFAEQTEITKVQAAGTFSCVGCSPPACTSRQQQFMMPYIQGLSASSAHQRYFVPTERSSGGVASRTTAAPRPQLHQEMAATMYQLHAIRDELRGGISLINPG